MNAALTDRAAEAVALVGGLGRIGPAPGTLASAAALPIGVGLHGLGGAPAVIATAVCVSGIGWWAAGRYARVSGRRDPSEVVVDEVAGMLIPLAAAGTDPVLIGIAFCLFRVFDIVKPFPVSWLDAKVSGGLGVMLDDLAAGVLALGGTIGVGVLRDAWF